MSRPGPTAGSRGPPEHRPAARGRTRHVRFRRPRWRSRRPAPRSTSRTAGRARSTSAASHGRRARAATPAPTSTRRPGPTRRRPHRRRRRADRRVATRDADRDSRADGDARVVPRVPPRAPRSSGTLRVRRAGTAEVRGRSTPRRRSRSARPSTPARATVELTSVPKAGGRPRRRSSSTGIFKITQSSAITTSRSPSRSPPCKQGKRERAAKKPKTRRLWGDGKGKFRTKGRYSAATVRGTKWLVRTRCAGTLTRVTQGSGERPRQGQEAHHRARAGRATSRGRNAEPTHPARRRRPATRCWPPATAAARARGVHRAEPATRRRARRAPAAVPLRGAARPCHRHRRPRSGHDQPSDGTYTLNSRLAHVADGGRARRRRHHDHRRRARTRRRSSRINGNFRALFTAANASLTLRDLTVRNGRDVQNPAATSP